MNFSLKPDFEESYKRYDAFFEGTIDDRPLVSIILPKDNYIEFPKKKYDSYKDQWLDIDYRAEQIAQQLNNQIYLGDAMPVAFPDMGPEFFSALCGCDYSFSETTAWSEPCIKDWGEDYDTAILDTSHPLLEIALKFTDNLIDLGKDTFITGLPDFHPGGDHLSALRDPANLAMDVIENKNFIKKKLSDSQGEFYKVYDMFYNKIHGASNPASTWLPLISKEKYYALSNDFSCMISTSDFEELFLDGLIDETLFYDKSIYHLDGPGALRHLDTILSMKNLNAVQWVPGAGHDNFKDWIDVYKKIQKAGKGIDLHCIDISEIDMLIDNLSPEGVFLRNITGIDSQDTAEKLLNKLYTKWK